MFADAFGVLSGNMSTVIGAAGGAEVDSNNIFSSCRGRKFALQVDNHQRFAQKFCSSADNFVGRLILKDELKSHTGCVNTINWNSSGSLAVSGSDDTTVCLWDYPALTLKKSVRTLHTANIFCAKFFPEKDEVSELCVCMHKSNGFLKMVQCVCTYSLRCYDYGARIWRRTWLSMYNIITVCKYFTQARLQRVVSFSFVILYGCFIT
eukprot:Lankesteria_metandrocarpae@DN5193_c1_g1_i1.p2